jgi:serine/threonine-protein kinase
LDDLEVDPSIGLVCGVRGRVRLEPRVMAVLEMLAGRPGELVSRTELLSEIWPGGTTYDEALTQCVYQLRQQLVSAGGDGCRDLVTTIPKRGYLLKGEVRPVEPDPLSESKPTTVPEVTRVISRRPVAWTALAAAALLVAWILFDRTDSSTSSPAPEAALQAPTIAVLPFLPLVEDERDPVLELGLADTLITRLSGVGEIRVRPISSVRWFHDLDRDALEAGRQLGVEVVLDGNVQRSGDQVRVTARLLRVASGTALWAGTFNEHFSGIFAVQDAICERIANALAVQLGQREREILEQAGTSDTEAYERYLKGRFYLARLTPADLLESIGHFSAAVERDPGYAQAWLGLANVQFRIPIAGEVPPREYYPQAKQAALKALEIDPSLAEGHAMLGWIAKWYDWDWDASESHFLRAIELDPNDTESHLGYAHLLSDTNRHAQALAEVRRARELSPFYLVAAALEGGFLLRAGQPDEAIRRMEEARELDPGFWLIRVGLAGAYLASGRPEDALAEARAAQQVSGGSTWATANEIVFLVRLGRADEARERLAELRTRATEHYVPPYDLAVAHAAVDDLDAAVVLLQRAFEVRDPKLTFLGHPLWSNLSDRPEYAELMRQTGLARFFE